MLTKYILYVGMKVSLGDYRTNESRPITGT